jgi:hypothetical protein
VLTDRDGLLDEMVQIFGNFGSETARLQDTENLVTSDGSDLRNTIRITKNNTNLRGSKTLLGVLTDHVNNFFRGSLNPRRRSAAIREGTARDTLTRSVHTTHIDEIKLKEKEKELHNFFIELSFYCSKNFFFSTTVTKIHFDLSGTINLYKHKLEHKGKRTIIL